MGTINMTGGSQTSNGYKLNSTVGQTFQGQFDSTGYRVRAGFQYVMSIRPFSFSISSLAINFPTLIPGTPSTQTNNLTVSNFSAYGYTVKTIEDHPLQIYGSTQIIPNTACDTGTPCTLTTANLWTLGTTYGFGYNMSGQDIDTSVFVNSNYYRPFPNARNNDSPATVMLNSLATNSSTATVTYKVNISGNQAAGQYQNSIQYIAVPAF